MDYWKVKEDLKYACEGLEQMQQPDAGYFEDVNDKQPHEIAKYNSDIRNQCKHIEKLEKQLMNIIKDMNKQKEHHNA